MSDDRSEKVVRATAKGCLYIELNKLGLSLADVESVWNTLQSFVASQAKVDGYKRGFPAMIFDSPGGTCIKIERD